MATASSFLSEDQFLCSVCLDVFKEPVAIPCGHNYCMACITKYWDISNLCQCPICKNVFYTRPDLHVNVLISEMADQFRKSVQVKAASSREHTPAKPGEVPCDVCEGTKLRALKSCLVCVTSYCEPHLEPHQRVPTLKRHTLIDPVENLEDRMCKKHERFLKFFCKTDQTYLCQFCTESDHIFHQIVPLEEEFKERMAQLGKTETQLQQMIQERQQRIKVIKHSVTFSKNDAQEEMAEAIKVCTALVTSIEKLQAEVIGEIEDKQSATEKETEGLIKEIKQEITELKGKSTELEQLSHTEDHLHFLQSFPTLYTSPLTKDWSKIHAHCHLHVGTVRRAVNRLYGTLVSEGNKLDDAELKKIKRFAVNVTLDPNTAHPQLILSEDGKEVSKGDMTKNLPDNPERFDQIFSVLGKEGFSTGRFYYEVEGNTCLHNFGVARESINRKGSLPRGPQDGVWTISWIQNMGVFVDYEEGQVSFYNLQSRVHITSYTGCTFTEKLYPYMCLYENYYGKTSTARIISPVTQV